MHFVAFILQTQPDPEVVRRLAVTALALVPILILIALAVIVLPFWFILKKAGFSPWLSFINIIPFGTLILLYVLAFADWRVAPEIPPVWLPQAPNPPQL
jgi:ABC-type transport system involved in cytochrome c biogenesis permease subunit